MFDFSYIKDLPIFYNQYKPKDVILVDADISQWSKVVANENEATKLHYIASPISNLVDKQISEAWKFYETILSNDGEEVQLYKYSLKFLDGQIPQDVLQGYWPNAHLKEQFKGQSISSEDFFTTNFKPESNKFIIFEKLGAISSIKNLDFDVNNIVLIAARILESEDECVSKLALSKCLETKGFKEVALYADHFPKMGMVVYVRDFESESKSYKQKIESLDEIVATKKADIAKLQQENKLQSENIVKLNFRVGSLNNSLESVSNDIKSKDISIDELSKDLELYKTKLDKVTSEYVESEAKYKQALGEKNTSLDNITEDVKKLREVILELNSAKESLAFKTRELEAMQSNLLDVNKKVFDRSELNEELKASLNRNNQQIFNNIQSFINLQNYFIHGSTPMSFYGFPISPDVGLFLIERLQYDKYDLIIEFGSGTSTILFSKILREQQKRVSNFPKVISFDHNEYYYKRTLSNLKSEGLESYVDLVYAPLSKYSYEGNSYMYYNCGDILNTIAMDMVKYKKVLVLVDGPPQSTGKNARFPALPYLYNHLRKCHVDLMLDDFNRPEENSVAKMWRAFLDAKKIEYSSEEKKFERGMYILKFQL
ncbi:coiled-coil domain-containing protein [Francisella salina]|uniref:Uncharacterized protein n=1 Tax=Francisella salina TaxID=573569 RepID=A0ABN3ZM26_FRAST|nr:hypothetical protein [Francisella salina]AEI35693.1 hypothetical protein F7308_0766 [Francisella salina]